MGCVISDSDINMVCVWCRKVSQVHSLMQQLSHKYAGSHPLYGTYPGRCQFGYGIKASILHLLSDQLLHNWQNGFKQLHIVGRTSFLLKATLLFYKYTVILKATSAEYLPNLKQKVKAYYWLHLLQGKQIPVCIRDFALQVLYWYHSQQIIYILILSWAGVWVKKVITGQTKLFFLQQHSVILSYIRVYSVTHNNAEWCNILWNKETNSLVVIDFESSLKPCNKEKAIEKPKVLWCSPLGELPRNPVTHKESSWLGSNVKMVNKSPSDHYLWCHSIKSIICCSVSVIVSIWLLS